MNDWWNEHALTQFFSHETNTAQAAPVEGVESSVGNLTGTDTPSSCRQAIVTCQEVELFPTAYFEPKMGDSRPSQKIVSLSFEVEGDGVSDPGWYRQITAPMARLSFTSDTTFELKPYQHGGSIFPGDEGPQITALAFEKTGQVTAVEGCAEDNTGTALGSVRGIISVEKRAAPSTENHVTNETRI